VRNKKRRHAKDRRDEAGMHHCANFADEVLAVINMVHTDTFVRLVEATQKRVPSVILYDDRQTATSKDCVSAARSAASWHLTRRTTSALSTSRRAYTRIRHCVVDGTTKVRCFWGPSSCTATQTLTLTHIFSPIYPRALRHAISNSSPLDPTTRLQ